ncbi:DgyrCDS6008 [Dimorphilus gyrociliatus]|uniref:Protein Wnt n=1 Tax=Dimorphilus gyrociliatus TaxID=2664684 RepID=A0A7I8VLP0_9ANNE|nr:DgyrCDS6008 [Dimorphilus gyrociliatus]
MLWIFFSLFPFSVANIWNLGTIQSVGIIAGELLCDNIPGLVTAQRRLCTRHPHLMQPIAIGIRNSIFECQFQFRYERWNCSLDWKFGGVSALVVSRESAFVHAIASASVLHTLSRSCDSGYPNCPCLHKYHYKEGGCSSSATFALRYGRKFIDAREKVSKDAQSVINLHNNRVGRRVLRQLQKKLCKCIGTSGSCIVRQCWKKNAPLRRIGQELRARYDKSKKVVARDGKIIFGSSSSHRNDLIFLENSPDYCSTSGRTCTLNNCDKLCCGRGFKLTKVERKNKCNCIFKWCCEVVCEVCSSFQAQTVCND